MIMSSLGSLALVASLARSVTAQATTSTSTPAPTASTQLPLTQIVYGYTPSEAAAGLFGGLFAISCAALFFRVFTNRTWWALCLPIGAFFMSVGFFVRIGLVFNEGSLGIFLIQDLFTLLSPTTFLAFNYILYGRFIVNCVPRGHSLIKPERTAKIFVLSDIVTFLIQGGGGGLLTSTKQSSQTLGANVILVGLAAQALSFGLYIILVLHAYLSLKRNGMKPFEAPWGIVLKLLFFTSAFFMVSASLTLDRHVWVWYWADDDVYDKLRCIYRTIEFGQGRGHGYLETHEVVFYVLDALPLFIGITTYAVWWPSRYIKSTVHSPLQLGDSRENSISLMPHGQYRDQFEARGRISE